MASAKMIQETVSFLKQTYRFDGPEIAAEWSRLLEGMTNAQIEVAKEYLREKHQSPYIPPMALFKAWSGGEDREKAWWKTQRAEEFHDEHGRYHVFAEQAQDKKDKTILRPVFVPHEPKKPVRLSEAEYRQRFVDLQAVMSGKLKGVDWSRFKNLHPEDTALRAELRGLMGWVEDLA